MRDSEGEFESREEREIVRSGAVGRLVGKGGIVGNEIGVWIGCVSVVVVVDMIGLVVLSFK